METRRWTTLAPALPQKAGATRRPRTGQEAERRQGSTPRTRPARPSRPRPRPSPSHAARASKASARAGPPAAEPFPAAGSPPVAKPAGSGEDARAWPRADPRGLGRRSANFHRKQGDRSGARRRDREGTADGRHRRADEREAPRGDSQLAVAQEFKGSGRNVDVPAPALGGDPDAAGASGRRGRRPPASSSSSSGSTGAARRRPSGSSLAAQAAGQEAHAGCGDTFRAAATEQLEVSGSRAGVPVVRGKEGADPRR